MTIQQCRYVLETAASGSINEAAKKLFVAQTSVSAAIKALEKELSINIFARSNKGVILTTEGIEFVRYAKELLIQENLIYEKFLAREKQLEKFVMSTQHFDFVVDMLADLLNESELGNFRFTVREGKSQDVISDVESSLSEIGVIAINSSETNFMDAFFEKRSLEFHEICTVSPHVVVRKDHPLASKKSISRDDITEYPNVIFLYGEYNSLFFVEKCTDESEKQSVTKVVEVSNRAALKQFLVKTNCYTVGTGLMALTHSEKVIAIPFDSAEQYTVGYILKRNSYITEPCQQFIKKLSEFKWNKNVI